MCGVVLSVSLLSCVTYIGLMGKVFPDGLFKTLCYVGAFSNFILMCALLWGKFVWFRPGLHEYASWGVNVVEIIVCILNLVLAFELSSTTPQHLDAAMGAWYMIAPITPVFSMIGAIILILTSDDLKRKHDAMLIEEQKARSEQELNLAQHTAQIEVQNTYVDFVGTEMANRLNSPEVHSIISAHANYMVAQTISRLSGINVTTVTPEQTPAPAALAQNATAPAQVPAPAPQAQLPAPATVNLNGATVDLFDFMKAYDAQKGGGNTSTNPLPATAPLPAISHNQTATPVAPAKKRGRPTKASQAQAQTQTA